MKTGSIENSLCDTNGLTSLAVSQRPSTTLGARTVYKETDMQKLALDGVAGTITRGISPAEAHTSPCVGRHLPPIEHLPVELLSDIFTLCVCCREYPPLLNDFLKPPISLCCVCRRWKKIACGLPKLWTAVSVDLDTIGSQQRKTLSYVLDRWFSRANQLPLAFKFTSRDNSDEKANEMLHTCIIPFAPRLRHLDIYSLYFTWPTPTDLESPELQSAITQNPPHNTSWPTFQFPELVSAIIRKNIEVYDDPDTPLFPFAPRLQQLRMDDLSFIGGAPAQLLVPWGQLTHLILVGLLESHLWLQLFPLCCNLQLGLFDIFEDIFGGIPSTTQRVAFNHLIDLTLAFHDPIDPSILSHFDFPALESLRLQNDLDNQADDSDRGDEIFWTDTIRRRFCQQLTPLRRLSLHGAWPLVCLLEAVKDVTELDVHNTEMFEAVLSSLLRRPDGYLPVPNLKVLVVDTADCSELRTNVLADIIKSRRYIAPRIERLVVFKGDPFQTQLPVEVLTEQLRPFIEDGFIVELKDAEPSHWSGRLDAAEAAEWLEGMFDIKD